MTRQAIPDWVLKNGDRNGLIRKKKFHWNATTVGNLLSSIQAIPANTLLLGQCTDGLPFMMELCEPEMGAILIGCDAGCGKTHQLQVMVDSAILTFSPHKMQIAILSPNLNEWESLQSNAASKKYIYDILSWYDKKAENLIKALTELAEARRGGHRLGADILFILDDLEHIEDLSFEAQVNLHWLLEYGSQSNVWVVGTIGAELASGFRYWINPFRTRIVGRVHASTNADILAIRPDSKASELDHGSFKAWAGTRWMTYSLVPLGS
jgi:hypothetical protein